MASALGAVRLHCSASSPAPRVRMDPKRRYHQLSFPCPWEHTLGVKGPEQLFSPSHKQQHTKALSCEGEQTSPRRPLPTALAGGDLGTALPAQHSQAPKPSGTTGSALCAIILMIQTAITACFPRHPSLLSSSPYILPSTSRKPF